MKKFIFVLICCFCFCGCGGKDYSKKILVCTKSEKNTQSQYVKESEYTLNFQKNGENKQLCWTKKYSYENERKAASDYNSTIKSNTEYNINEDCKLNGKTFSCSGCNSDFSGFGEKRGTIEKEKEFFEGEGYSCIEKDANK